MSPGLRALVLGTALGSAAVGGVFLAFSTFVLHALRQLPAAQGLEAMQSVNRSALRAPFLTAFGGTAAAAVAVLAAAPSAGQGRAAALAAGSALYLVGVGALTAVRNVPLNNSLAVLDPRAPASAAAWSGYVRRWGRWNALRAVAGLAGAAVLVLSAQG